jgi:hypothetical protein
MILFLVITLFLLIAMLGISLLAACCVNEHNQSLAK